LKTRTFFEAARNNRPCAWTGDDLEAPTMSQQQAVALGGTVKFDLETRDIITPETGEIIGNLCD
jgi:hypothetical protein